MRAFENIIAVLCVILLLFVLIFIRSEHYKECCETSAKSLVGSFLAETSMSGEITRLSYDMCTRQLYDIGYQGGFTITVIDYEIGTDRRDYRYVTTWDEILEKIVKEGSYKCPEGSCVKVAVEADDERFSRSLRHVFSGLKDFIKVEYVKEGTVW